MSRKFNRSALKTTRMSRDRRWRRRMFQIYDEACISFLRKGFRVTETFSFTLDRVSFFVCFGFSPAFPPNDLLLGNILLGIVCCFVEKKLTCWPTFHPVFTSCRYRRILRVRTKRILRLEDFAVLFVSFQPKTFYFAHSVVEKQRRRYAERDNDTDLNLSILHPV